MKTKDEFAELEKQLRATVEPVEPLRLVEKNHLRPRYASVSFPWHKMAAPLGFCAVCLIALLAYSVIRTPIVDDLQEVASEVVPTATATQAVDPTLQSVTIVSKDEAIAYALEEARSMEPVEFGNLELISAELSTPSDLAFDANTPDPTLPEQFWAVTFTRTATHITENCTILTKERYQLEHTRWLSLSCSERLPFAQFADDFVRTSAPTLIAQPDTTIAESRAEIRSITVLPSDRDGYSQVEVTVPYEHASRDGRLILHWGYFYQTVSNSGMEEANTGDIVVQPGQSRGVASFRFEVNDLLITNGSATNLFLSSFIRPAVSETLVGKRFVYVAPEDLREYEDAVSAEAFAKLGIDVQTVNRWEEVLPLHQARPIDVLIIHHVFVQFRPQPIKELVDKDTIAQFLSEGVAIVGVGVDHHGILSAGEFGSGWYGAPLDYSLIIKSDTQSIRKYESLLLSNGWGQLLENLEEFYAE